MILRRLMITLGCCTLLISPGCTMWENTMQTSRTAFRQFKPKTSGYRDWNEEEEDEYRYVGDLARGDRAKEKDPDSWWQKHIMSAKARSIESNLGIENIH